VAAARKQLKLLWVSCGDQDSLFNISENVHKYLDEQKVAHVWHVDAEARTRSRCGRTTCITFPPCCSAKPDLNHDLVGAGLSWPPSLRSSEGGRSALDCTGQPRQQLSRFRGRSHARSGSTGMVGKREVSRARVCC
jgi:hypothetical protein